MIIDKNINPERDLYYLGGILIDILENKEYKEVDYMDLYTLINNKKEITINLFSLTLDWLFVLGLVAKGENGKIKICF
ncbi:ABC-three component system middle component 6 [Mariniflexile ostreae]|uniref:ABC-three component system middle component 6 n=1 Tax=Mariniflexile ostreae TaxID=1520892 RepID=A0ABV5FFP5_9FLAO